MAKPFPGRPPKKDREQGINDIEIICKYADQVRTVAELREYVTKQIEIYTTILKLLDKEFNHEDFKSLNDDSRYHAFIGAMRKLG